MLEGSRWIHAIVALATAPLDNQDHSMTTARNDRETASLPPAARVEAVTLQFHPDWPHQSRTVIESMAIDGAYRSQFTTAISNGGLTAFRGGDRWRWESRLFSGRYDEASPVRRPVYGAWNRAADPYGGAVRFGSCYVRLRPEALRRSTFCFPDSFLEPEDVGDARALYRLCHLADESDLDALDDYVEAHVHGPVQFDTDVEALVLDPCFITTDIMRTAEKLGCRLELHHGFRASIDDIDPQYRGADIVELARSLGDDLTPRNVGEAARSREHHPQAIKQLWHCLARFGRT